MDFLTPISFWNPIHHKRTVTAITDNPPNPRDNGNGLVAGPRSASSLRTLLEAASSPNWDRLSCYQSQFGTGLRGDQG